MRGGRKRTGRTKPLSRSFYNGSQSSRHPTSSEIYNDLLNDALRQSSQTDNRPLKKRKSQRDESEITKTGDNISIIDDYRATTEREIVVIDNSASEVSEGDDDEEMEWDNIDLAAAPLPEDIAEAQRSPEIREVTLTTIPQKSTFYLILSHRTDFSSKKRAAITPRNATVRTIRLEAHKMHLLSLLASFRYLNHLLSSPSLLKILRQYIPPATINALNTGPEHTQARRTIAFLSGLKDIVSTWSQNWKETKRGWRRPRWVETDDLGKVILIVCYFTNLDPCILGSC